MKKIALLVVVLFLISISSFAGEYLANETMEAAYGLQVIFSEPVTITDFGDSLMVVKHTGVATEFVFSGGEVGSLEGQWFSWEPATAVVTRYKWLAEGDSLSTTPLDAVAQDFIYEVPIADLGTVLTIDRHVERNQLPFEVHYEIANPQSLDGCLLAWDADKYVDSDGDGDAQNDRDAEGATLDLIYVENYNPTVTLLVYDSGEVLAALWENMVRNDFEVGSSILLDANALAEAFGVEPPSVGNATWVQRHMDQMSFEYMTEYGGQLLEPTSLFTSARHSYPGKYVYQLSASDGASFPEILRVAAWVVDPSTPRKPVGLMMSDFWNENYEPSIDAMVSALGAVPDSQAVEKLRYLSLSGFNDIVVMNQFPIESVYPTIQITEAASGIHIIPNQDLEMIFHEVLTGHLSWQTYYFQSDNAGYWTNFDLLSRSYYDDFFKQYKERVLEKAVLAEDLSLSSFTFGFQHPYLWGLDDIERVNASDARWVRDQWIELCEGIAQVYSGSIGLGVPGKDSRVAEPIAEHIDFVYENLGNFGGMSAQMSWAKTVVDLRTAYSSYLQAAVSPTYQNYRVPIRFTFWAFSHQAAATNAWNAAFEHATYDTWRSEFAWMDWSDEILSGRAFPDYPPSFQEQVKMIEALMPVLADTAYIEGIYSEYEYWKLLSFEDFQPANILDYQSLFTASLQGKPGFDAFRLWASMLHPNERLLYRRAIPLDDNDNETIIGDVLTLSESLEMDWALAPFQIEFPADFRPTTYWFEGTHPISASKFWDLPGHDVESVSFQFTPEVLGLYWESRANDMRNKFEYEVSFSAPDGSASLSITVQPAFERIEIFFRDSERWIIIPTNEIGYKISDESVLLLIPDIELSSDYSISDISDWRIEISLCCLVPEEGERYELFSGDSYNSVLTGTAGEPVVETIESHPMASALDEVLGSSTWTDVPKILTWPDTNSFGFATYHSDTGSVTNSGSPDARFNGAGWHISGLRGGIVGEGIVLCLEFAADDRPSADPAVEYVIQVGQAGDGLFVSPSTLECDYAGVVIPPRYIEIGERFVGVVIPFDLIPDALSRLETAAQRTVTVSVSYRGGFGSDSLMDGGMVFCSGEGVLEEHAPMAAALDEVLALKKPEAEPDWVNVPYTYSYRQTPSRPVEYSVNGIEMEPVLTNWGLAGSDVKGVKLLCQDEGLFIRWETRGASLPGEYSYVLHLWRVPTHTLLAVSMCPKDASVGASLMGDGQWSEQAAYLVDLDASSITAWLPRPDVLCSGSSQSLRGWDLIPMLQFEEPGSLEFFEFPLLKEL